MCERRLCICVFTCVYVHKDENTFGKFPSRSHIPVLYVVIENFCVGLVLACICKHVHVHTHMSEMCVACMCVMCFFLNMWCTRSHV